MIGLDTNILVRFLTQDDPKTASIAADVLENKLTEEHPGFISLVVLAETAWVLRRTYGYSIEEIGIALEALLQPSSLIVDSEAEVLLAINPSRQYGTEFPDALVAAIASAAGCSITLTFDRKVSRLPGFELAK